jgi:signal peptidase I
LEQNPDHISEAVGGDGFDYERFAAEEAAREAAKSKPSEPDEKQTATAIKKPTSVKDGSSEVYDWVQCLVAALLFCVLLFSFFVRIIGIVGTSMVPTFDNGDSVVISKLFYTPKQGDVVVLRKESFQEEPIIKRVIAVEGQTVSIDFDEHIVYVDGEALDEPYIYEPTTESLDFDGMITVPENCVFVMGDNRNNSLDSRFSLIGCVDEREIMGKVLFRVLPIDKFGAVD